MRPYNDHRDDLDDIEELACDRTQSLHRLIKDAKSNSEITSDAVSISLITNTPLIGMMIANATWTRLVVDTIKN